MLGMSGFDVSSPTVSNAAGVKLRAKSQRSVPTADIHPPFKSQLDAKLRGSEMVRWVTENIPRRSVGLVAAQDFGMGRLFDCWCAEGLWGMSQEQLLCLGRANGLGVERLIERLVGGWEEVGKLWEGRKRRIESTEDENIPDKLSVVLYWANGDGMIPLKGRGESTAACVSHD